MAPCSSSTYSVGRTWAEKPEAVPYSDLLDPQSLNLYTYVRNNPVSRTDADGHDVTDWINFAVGLANAWTSDNAAGAGRQEQDTAAGKAGQAVGDLGATVTGSVEVVVGSGGEAGGTALDATGGGAVLGIPLQVASAGIIAHGAVTGVVAAKNLAGDVSPALQSSGPKANDAPGVTAGGQATNEHGQKLGPSGKPQANNVSSNTREAAKNAANKGSGTIEDSNPRQGRELRPHFHTKRGTGVKKQDNVHYIYPK